MASDEVELDEHLFRRAAAKTGHAQDRITGILETLGGVVASNDGCWGSDKIGTTFANGEDGKGGYIKSAKALTENGDAIATSLGNMSESQSKSAEFIHNMELDNEAGLR
ncbi:hypothetical protein ACFVVM_28715 [Nocardia sp. NPDC058176]|uniref:hypothetical protein n=1 Tax=Nocardia sp. NPDC058176 TaxID=3346368 RepID=UPI0036DB5B8A